MGPHFLPDPGLSITRGDRSGKGSVVQDLYMGCSRPVKGFLYLSGIDKTGEIRSTHWFFDPVSKGWDQMVTEMTEGPRDLCEGHGFGGSLAGRIVQYVEII
jgi:hypothetical protein